MMMKLKHLIVFYYFLFIFTLIVIKAADPLHSLTDSLQYKNIPIVNDLDNCKAQSLTASFEKCQKVWWLRGTKKYLEHFKQIPDINELACLEECFNTTDCKAILIFKNRTIDSQCFLYKNISVIRNNLKYWTFTLSCCELQKKEPFKNLSIPIVFNEEQNCYKKSTRNNWNSCPNERAWLHQENVDLSPEPFLSLWNKETINDCMNVCLNNKICQSITVEYYGHYSRVCHLHSYTPGGNKRYNNKTISYEMICCKPALQSIWTITEMNLLMHTHTDKLCSVATKIKNVRTCKVKVWQVEDSVRFKGHYLANKLITVQQCLNGCLKDTVCIAVSVDYREKRCLFFRDKITTRIVDQSFWFSYTLKCCSVREIGSVGDKPDYPKYPMIYNIDTQCFNPVKNTNLATCASKVWLVEFHRHFKSDYSSDLANSDAECLYRCVTSKGRKCIFAQRSLKASATTKDGCFLFDVNNSNAKKGHRSYSLKCCDIKPEQWTIDPNKNLPLMFDSDEYCAKASYYNFEACDNKIWHINEKTDYLQFYYKRETSLNRYACLYECQRDSECRGIVVEVFSDYQINCEYYKYLGGQTVFNASKTFYEMICCQPTDLKEYMLNPPNYLMSHEENQMVCSKTSYVKDKSCSSKIWLIQEGIKVVDSYAMIPLDDLETCLKQCHDTEACFSVSVDYAEKRCLFLKFEQILDKNKAIPYQLQWITYTLKCCDFNIQIGDDSTSNNTYELIMKPMIFDREKTCIPTDKVKPPCQLHDWQLSDGWRHVDGVRLGKPMDEAKFISLGNCLSSCYGTQNCIAVSKGKGNTASPICTLHSFDYVVHNDSQYKSYFLECCELKVKDVSEASEPNLPIILNALELCQKNSLNNDLAACPTAKSWQMFEYTYIDSTTKPYKEIKNIEIIDCLNACVKENQCKAIVVEDLDDYETLCHFYNRIDPIKHGVQTKTLYKIICCNTVDSSNSLKFKNTNLLILYNTNHNCPAISVTNVKFCKVKIWKVKEKVRMSGHYNVYLLDTVENCLNACSLSTDCIAVSIDYYDKKCLFFHRKGNFLSIIGQDKWISYTLQCCVS